MQVQGVGWVDRGMHSGGGGGCGEAGQPELLQRYLLLSWSDSTPFRCAAILIRFHSQFILFSTGVFGALLAPACNVEGSTGSND